MAEEKKTSEVELMELLNNIGVRLLLNERATVVTFLTLKKLLVDKKLVTEEEFDKAAE